jgi:solute carrier family 30 (zinc transporter), member 1
VLLVGFRTHSLALIADAFHYVRPLPSHLYSSVLYPTDLLTLLKSQLNDVVGFSVALAALILSQHGNSPKEFSFGWRRANSLGAFFNGVFLAALGLNVLLQALERFVSLQSQ